METTFVLSASDLTPDFIDGISKVFPKNAKLQITVQYGEMEAAAAPAKRGRKPGVPAKASASKTGKKRGPKPGPRKAAAPEEVATPKKRGRKPKISTPVE